MRIDGNARFTFDSWDDHEVLDVEGARIVRTTFVKRFTGDLEGTSRGEMVMAHALQGSAAYSGYERVEGTLAGRTGGFICGTTHSWPRMPAAPR